MSYDPKAELKDKLCAYIDRLYDNDGFVLTVTSDDINFVRLKAAGWDEHVLEFEPFVLADIQKYVEYERKRKAELEKENASLATKIAKKKKELALIEAAIAKATGRGQD